MVLQVIIHLLSCELALGNERPPVVFCRNGFVAKVPTNGTILHPTSQNGDCRTGCNVRNEAVGPIMRFTQFGGFCRPTARPGITPRAL